MANETLKVTELFKYALTVFSNFLALIVNTQPADLELSMLTVPNTHGIKFPQETKSEVGDLASRLAAIEAVIADAAQYYQGRKSLRTVPCGTKTRTISVSAGLEHEFATKFWAQIEIP